MAKILFDLFLGGDLVIFFPRKKGICDQFFKNILTFVWISYYRKGLICVPSYKHGNIIQQHNEILMVNCTMAFNNMKHLNWNLIIMHYILPYVNHLLKISIYHTYSLECFAKFGTNFANLSTKKLGLFLWGVNSTNFLKISPIFSITQNWKKILAYSQQTKSIPHL